LQRILSRTSESHGHWQTYDSSAAFDLKSLRQTSRQAVQGLQIGGTGVSGGFVAIGVLFRVMPPGGMGDV
jgi:hypothetical protein